MFRFTIRELLLLTVIAAVGIGWWQEHSRLASLANELKSRNEQLAALRGGPNFYFHMETARLEEELKKRGPLVRFLGPLPRRSFFVEPYHDPWQQAMLARQKLEKDADAAGYVITAGKDGRPTLEPKPGYWKERPAVSPPDDI